MMLHAAVVALSDATHNSPTMASSLDKLVDDILIEVFQTLSVHAVLSLRKVSPGLDKYKRELKGHRRLDATISSVNSAASGTLGFALMSWRVICLYPVPHVPSPCSLRRSSSSALCEHSTLRECGHGCLRIRSFPGTRTTAPARAWTKSYLFRVGQNY